MFIPLDIKSKEQIEKINNIASNAPFEVWLSTPTLMLDARSLLGLYSLIGKKVNVVAEDNISDKAFRKLVNKMAVA